MAPETRSAQHARSEESAVSGNVTVVITVWRSESRSQEMRLVRVASAPGMTCSTIRRASRVAFWTVRSVAKLRAVFLTLRPEVYISFPCLSIHLLYSQYKGSATLMGCAFPSPCSATDRGGTDGSRRGGELGFDGIALGLLGEAGHPGPLLALGGFAVGLGLVRGAGGGGLGGGLAAGGLDSLGLSGGRIHLLGQHLGSDVTGD